MLLFIQKNKNKNSKTDVKYCQKTAKQKTN